MTEENTNETPNLNDVPRLYEEEDVIDLLTTLGMGTEEENYVVDGKFVWGAHVGGPIADDDTQGIIDNLGEPTLGVLLRAGFNVCCYPQAEATQDRQTGDITVELGEHNGKDNVKEGQIFHRTTMDSPEARTGGKVTQLTA